MTRSADPPAPSGDRLPPLCGLARRYEASAYAMGTLAHQLANSRLRRLTAPFRTLREIVLPRRFGLRALRPALGVEQLSHTTWRVFEPGGEWFVPHIFRPGEYRLVLAFTATMPMDVELIFDAGTALVQTLRLAAGATGVSLDHRFTLHAPACAARLAVGGAGTVSFAAFQLGR